MTTLRRGLLCGLALWQAGAFAVDPAPPAARGSAAGTPSAPPAPATATPVTAPAAGASAGAKPAAGGASDREAALAAELPRLAAPGEAVTLEADGAKFFAFYRAGERKPPAVGLLVVPAIGEFIDEQAVIRALRTNVPRGGIATLAIQPPIPAANADPAAHAALAAPLCARVKAGLAHLNAQGDAKLAIVAAATAADAMPGCFKAGWPKDLIGFAALGPWYGTLADLKAPAVLDVVPMHEEAAVKAAEARRREARTAQPERAYRRTDVDVASRTFEGAEPMVAYAVRGWLKRLVDSQPVPAKPAASPVPAAAPGAKPGGKRVKG